MRDKNERKKSNSTFTKRVVGSVQQAGITTTPRKGKRKEKSERKRIPNLASVCYLFDAPPGTIFLRLFTPLLISPYAQKLQSDHHQHHQPLSPRRTHQIKFNLGILCGRKHSHRSSHQLNTRCPHIWPAAVTLTRRARSPATCPASSSGRESLADRHVDGTGRFVVFDAFAFSVDCVGVRGSEGCEG